LTIRMNNKTPNDNKGGSPPPSLPVKLVKLLTRMEQKLAAQKDGPASASEASRQVKGIFQFCIRKVHDDKYSIVAIYQMTDNSLMFWEGDQTYNQVFSYLKKKGLLEYLPKKDGQTIYIYQDGEKTKLPTVNLLDLP
jgi:hypothetical protein